MTMHEITPDHSPRRYSRVAIALHWLIAILIILNFIGAFASEDLQGAEKAYALAGHKAFGIIILILSVLRLIWRWTHPRPALPDGMKSWEVTLSHITHRLFYGLMIAIPLAGWAMHSAYSGGAPISIFQMFDFPGLPMAKAKATAGLFHDVHEALAFLMLLLLALHLGAVLKHTFINRDGILRRMWFWG